MNPFVIQPIRQPFDVSVTLPGSKSIALRQLTIAALTNGVTQLHGLPPCDDIDAMLDCLTALGVRQTGSYDSLTLHGPMQMQGNVTLNARMSGASTRLLIGLAAIRQGTTTIDGHPSLRVRTNAPLFDVLRQHGCAVDSDNGQLPAVIHGGFEPTNPIQIDGSLSSQYITALMVIAPLLAKQSIDIEITGALVSRPYLDITAAELSKRGIAASWIDTNRLQIQCGEYQTGAATVEGDATAATYFAALATLHGSRIQLTNLGQSTQQGDYQFFAIMEQLGANVSRSETQTIIQGPEKLQSLAQIDMTTMPDAALTLIAMGPLLPDGIHITGLSSLHHKECDRLLCPANEFASLGVSTDTTDDTIRLHPAASPLVSHQLNTYHDHRMAMAFSVFASRTEPLPIDDARVVDKTFPAYWDEYLRLSA